MSLPEDAFRRQPELTGSKVRLEPLGLQHFDGLQRMHDEPEVARLTGSIGRVSDEVARQWVASRQDHHDRADWAIVRQTDGVVLGEVVLNEFDPDNAAANFRILLVAPEFFGQGFGTEATRLVLGYAFDTVGLHRVSLGVFDFNPRAQHVYAACGFVREGVHRDALRWDGQWHDEISMAVLATDPRS